MSAVIAAGRRFLPRGYADLGLQFLIWFGFGIWPKGSWLALLAVTFPFLLASLSIGVFVSTLATAGRKGTTFALDVTTGDQVWSFPDGRYSPAVGVDGLLILSGRQVLYGLAPS